MAGQRQGESGSRARMDDEGGLGVSIADVGRYWLVTISDAVGTTWAWTRRHVFAVLGMGGGLFSLTFLNTVRMEGWEKAREAVSWPMHGLEVVAYLALGMLVVNILATPARKHFNLDARLQALEENLRPRLVAKVAIFRRTPGAGIQESGLRLDLVNASRTETVDDIEAWVTVLRPDGVDISRRSLTEQRFSLLPQQPRGFFLIRYTHYSKFWIVGDASSEEVIMDPSPTLRTGLTAFVVLLEAFSRHAPALTQKYRVEIVGDDRETNHFDAADVPT
jgi:hypothetical protein